MVDFLITKDQLRRASDAVPTSNRSSGRQMHGPRADDADLAGRWLSDEGLQLSEPFAIFAPSTRAEAFRPSGQIEYVDIETGLFFSAEPAAGAGRLRVEGGGGTLFDLPLAVLQAPLALSEVAPTPFGPTDAPFAYPIFSERFAAEEEFLEAVDQLHRWILGIPPFDTEDVRTAFRLDAYFWPTDETIGHFKTPDIAYDCAHPPASAVVFCGDNDIARSRLHGLLLQGRFGIVLINSRVRGGAGGVPERGYPAWVSITACPDEDWQAVALHEIGHGLGLADEYLDSGHAHEAPGPEPNFVRSSDFDAAAWRDLLTEQPPTVESVYSLERQRLIGTAGHPVPAASFVGLFQGARYRTDLYRASYSCLMRSTGTKHFCPVCARNVRARITGR